MFVEVRLQIRILRKSSWVIAKSATRKDIRHMNAEPGPCIDKELKDIAIIVRSMGIEILNANPNLCGH